MVLKISFCVLTLAVHLAASSEYSGLISRLYKKATEENRPLVLVLDNSKGGSVQESLQSYNDPRPRVSQNDKSVSSQVKLLELLSKKLNPRKETKAPVYDHPITAHKHSDLHRLQERLDRDIRERRERRLKKQAEKERNRHQQLRDEDSDQEGKGRFQPRAEIILDKKRVSFQLREDDAKQRREERDREEKKALRTSVIKSLLRTYNDLNCEAKDECKDECEDTKKDEDACADKCEKKFECEDDTKSRDSNCNEGNDTCEQDDEKNISTRGIPLEAEPTEKCKRC